MNAGAHMPNILQSLITLMITTLGLAFCGALSASPRPNFLLAISDDQSWPHASAYGNQSTKTPAFDRVAREGVLCNNAFVAYPSCSPSRASLLTGRYPWQIEHAGNFSSTFPPMYPVYSDILENAGYWVGYTGKGWGPGDWRGTGRLRNPAGTEYNRYQMPAPKGINGYNYARNFKDFLRQRPEGKPFLFWFGCKEPHRGYSDGIGRQNGKRLADAAVPEFLPDTPIVRSDLLDYSFEIEWFDQHLGRMLKQLEDRGELDNTLVIVTSDNGMPFPRAKANDYEFGIHVPMAIMWPERIPGNRVLDDMISFVDLAPTFLEAAEVTSTDSVALSGKSLLRILQSKKQGQVDPSQNVIHAGRERHASARYRNYGYPQRVIRTQEYLYVRNFQPGFWPAGQPQAHNYDGTLGAMHGAYFDIDSSPSKSLLIERRNDAAIAPFFQMAMSKRAEDELYNIQLNPGCVRNLVNDPNHAKTRKELRSRLDEFLTRTGDARLTGDPNIFRTYKRVVRGHRLPYPDNANPGPAAAIKKPVRERKGGELPKGCKAGVDVVIEVLAGRKDCPNQSVSMIVPEPLRGHPGFRITRLDNDEAVELKILKAAKKPKAWVWQLGGGIRAGTSRRFRVSPLDKPARAIQQNGRLDSASNGPPWVYIIHGRQ